jgi:hypothetical protein
MLDWDMNHHLLQNFSEIYFPNFHHDAWNLGRYWKLSNYDIFCVDHSLPTPYTYHLQQGEDPHQGEL